MAKKDSKKKSKTHTSYQIASLRSAVNALSSESYEVLNELSKVNNIANVCVRILQNAVRSTPWAVTALDGTEEDVSDHIKYVEDLLKKPNSNGETYNRMIMRLVEDIARIDNGVIEKVRNVHGEVIELYSVDGSTIYPNVNDYGIFEEDAYQQFINTYTYQGTPDAAFSRDDLLVFQTNPQGGKYTGYGSSPVKAIVHTIVTQLQLMNYNAGVFNTAKIPPVLVNFKNADDDELKVMRVELERRMSENQHALGFISAEDMSAHTLRPSNSDMEYQAFYDSLIRIVAVGFGLSPMDLGVVQDVNRSTAEVQESISASRGVASMLVTIEDEINNDLIGDLAKKDEKFNRVTFKYLTSEKRNELEQAQVDSINISMGVYGPEYVRVRDGIEVNESDLRSTGYDIFSSQDLQKSKWIEFYHQ